MCDLIRDVIRFCVWSSDTGKIIVGLYDKIVIETKKKGKCGNNFFYINPHVEDGLEIDFTAC